MLESLRRLLTPPVFENEEKTAAAQLLFWLLVLATVIEFFALIVVALIVPERLPFLISVIVINGITFYILRHGQVNAVGVFFITALWIILTINSYTSYGIY